MMSFNLRRTAATVLRAVCVILPVGAAAAAMSLHAARPSAPPLHPAVQPADAAPGCTAGPTCQMHGAGRSFELALDAYCQGTPDPARLRASILDRVSRSSLCFSPSMTPEQFNYIVNVLQGLPPGLVAQGDGLRFFTDSPVWTGNGLQGASLRAQPAVLTYSFPNDGTSWDGGNNVLTARFNTLFGAGNVDKGRELIRQALAGWHRIAGLTYTEVADNNTALDNSTTHLTTRGDVRFGARSQDGAGGVLAYDYFPSGGSDMVLDADDFVGNSFGSSTNNYRFFRNCVSHEHGHGLAFIHSVPCSNTKLMEPFLSTSFDMQQIDEIRGAQRDYGDRFAGNTSAATAHDFGDLTTPFMRSVIERSLSTNGASGFNGTSTDWFKFTLSSSQPVVITVAPTGGTYTEGQQNTNVQCDPGNGNICCGNTAAVNAVQAGNLNLELRDSAGSAILMSSTSAAAGSSEVITANPLAAGTYTVRVIDAGPNATADQFVQLYDLTIRVGAGAGAHAPPQAVAGVNKRIQANTTCYFMGNISSRATETGASITAYAWDLDGDGTFEIPNTAEPTHTYAVNGTYTVTLRVTDSNGFTDTDSIQVTVFGGAANVSLTGVSPIGGMRGQTIPVTLTGTGLSGVTTASTVTVSGTGVSVTGTPTPNGNGTQVTGLSFVIDPAAALGARNVTVTTVDGTSTLTNGFTVNANTQPTVASVTPNFTRPGFSTPVTIVGTNFGGVTTAGQVTISGVGVTAQGTPVVSPDNTTITGLSFAAAIDAPAGTSFRSVTVTTAAGSGSLVNGFRVRCLADWDGDSVPLPADIAAFVNAWSSDLQSGTLQADVDHDGAITPSDVATFVNVWFAALANNCL